MTDKKKDLTSIEDLGEYLHEINSEETSFETNLESDEVPAFESTPEFGSSDFGSLPTEEAPSFEPPPVDDEAPAFEPAPDFETAPEDSPGEEVSFLSEEVKEEPTPIYTPEPIEESPIKAPETFEEVKRFAESTSFTGMAVEGNPSFSVLLKNIRYVEDANDILALLRELGLLSDSEEQTRSRLMRGNLLIPRISEYAAVFLAHKLRRFDIDLQLGLSDEIHPPKHHEAPEVGLVSKASLHQNQSHHFNFDNAKLGLSDIIVAATPTLEGHQVIRYLGVASEHKMLEGEVVEDEHSSEIPAHYQELAQKLKAHALKAQANAVVGLNYQLTPLPSEFGQSTQKYRLTCTGNLVWVNRL